MSNAEEWPLVTKAVMRIQTVSGQQLQDCDDNASKSGLLQMGKTCPKSSQIVEEPNLMPPGQVFRY